MRKGAHQLVARALYTPHTTKWKVSLRNSPRLFLAVEKAHDVTFHPSSSSRCFSSLSPTTVASVEENTPKPDSKPDEQRVDTKKEHQAATMTDHPVESMMLEPPSPTDAATKSNEQQEPPGDSNKPKTPETDSASPKTAASSVTKDDDDDDDFASEFGVDSEYHDDPAKLHPGIPPPDLFREPSEDYKNLSMEERNARYRRAYYHGTTFVEAWATVWASGQTPFDLGRPTPALAEALIRKGMKFTNILVPGFGTGHDLITLAKLNPGCSVLGVEISGSAMYKAEKVLNKAYKNREVTESRIDLICGDFFDDRQWDIYYDFDPANYTEEAIRKRKEEEEEAKKQAKEENWDDELTDHEDEDDKKVSGTAGPVNASSKDETSVEEKDVKDEVAKNDTTAKDEGAAKDDISAKDDDKAKDADTKGEATKAHVPDTAQASGMAETKETGIEPEPNSESSSISKTPIPDELAKQEPEIGEDNPKSSVPELDDGLKDLMSKMSGKKEDEDEEYDPEKDKNIPVGFDFIYDYGFFSSLPKRVRLQYAERMTEMLTPDTGRLLTIMYPVDDIGCTGPLDGPPFHATVEDYKTLLEPLGVVMEGEPYESPDTVPSRVGQELICWWRRADPVKPKKDNKRKEKKKNDWGDDSDDEGEAILHSVVLSSSNGFIVHRSFSEDPGYPISSKPTAMTILHQAASSSPVDRPVLAVVDGVAFITFAAIGKSSHAADGSVDVATTLAVAAPFLLSWWATSPWTNVYETKSNSSNDNEAFDLSDVILTTIRGWIVAVPLGIALRGIIKGYVPPTPFIFVTMVATLIILCLARVVHSLAEQNLLKSKESA